MAPRPAAAVCLGPGLLLWALLAALLAALAMLLAAEVTAALLEPVIVVTEWGPRVTTVVAEALVEPVLVAAAVAQVALVGKSVAPLFWQNCVLCGRNDVNDLISYGYVGLRERWKLLRRKKKKKKKKKAAATS